jgi:hypothetical protein
MFTAIPDFLEQGSEGPLQYIDAFQRGNFWGNISTIAPHYHLILGQPTVLSELALTVVPANGAAVNGNTFPGYGGCVGAGSIFNLTTQFISLLGSQEVMQLPADSLVIFLTYDVFGANKAPDGYWQPNGGGGARGDHYDWRGITDVGMGYLQRWATKRE